MASLDARLTALESTPTPAPAPAITTPAAINSDGTPQVGKLLTGIDPVGTNGTVTLRRWFLGTTALASTATYTPVSTGAHRFEATFTGTNGSVLTSNSTVTVAAASDTTAPTLSSATSSQTGQTTATIGVTTNEANGSLYFFVSTSSTPPSATALKAGTGAVTSGALSITSTGAKSQNLTQLTAATQYYTHWLHRDAAGNDSAILTGPGFATAAAGSDSVRTFATAGSSTFDRYFNDATVADSRVRSGSNGTSYNLVGTTGAPITRLGASIADGTGATSVRFIGKARSGTLLSEWEADASTDRAGLVTAINNAAAAGIAMDGLFVGVGFNDATGSSPSVVSREAHAALYRSFLAKIRSETSLPNLKAFMVQSQRKSTGSNATIETALTRVRAAEYDVSQDANNFLCVISYDLPQISDGVHFTPEGFLAHADRLAKNALAGLGFGTRATGPRFTSIAPVTNKTTRINFSHSGGTDITPASAITGAQLLINGSVVTPSAVARLSATSIMLTHAEATASGQAIVFRYAQGSAPDVTSSMHDNSALALPAIPTTDDLQAVTLAPSVTAPTVRFASDDFAEAGTPVTDDQGNTWTVANGVWTSDGAAYATTVAATLVNGFAPSTAECNVAADLFFKTVNSQNSFVVFDFIDTANFMYAGRSNFSGGWIIGSRVADSDKGAQHTVTAFAPVAGQTYRVLVEVRNDRKALYVDGVKTVEVLKSVVPAGNWIDAAGKTGLRASTATSTATAGPRFDNFRVEDLV